MNSSPHLNTDQTDTGTLAYLLPVQADPEAKEYTDGRAIIGRRDPVPLTGELVAD